MSNCELCRKITADKKGSHIIPHFLLKRVLNVDGAKGRDHELGFVIKPFDTDSFFGRSVLPDKIEEVFGELSDEDIEVMSEMPYVVDYLFCEGCESRLATLESEYAKTLTKSEDDQYKSGVTGEIGLLFWMSVLWRISIRGNLGVTMKKGECELMRRVLDSSISRDLKQINIETIGQRKDLRKVSYKLLRSPDYSDELPTFILFHPKFQKPYFLIIDEFVLAFSLNSHYEQVKTHNMLGINEKVLKAPINGIQHDEWISCLSIEEFGFLVDQITLEAVNVRLKNLNNFFDELNLEFGRKVEKMPDFIKKEILAELTSEDKKEGVKHTKADLILSTQKVLKKYAP